MYLESFEKLPRPYIDYGTKMYESRYNFAKELVRKSKETHKKDLPETPDDLENR